jgi:DNA-binding response OmpR family regulator
VEAVLRRSPERPNEINKARFDSGVADFARCEIRYSNGERCELSEREVELLRYLVSNSGRVISRDEILLRVWRLNPKRMETRTIDMHIANLREKLRDNSDAPKVLLTVRGKGYMFAAAEK